MKYLGYILNSLIARFKSEMHAVYKRAETGIVSQQFSIALRKNHFRIKKLLNYSPFNNFYLRMPKGTDGTQ